MSKVCCKWVSEYMRTRNNTCWDVGVPKKLPEKNDLVLCGEGLFHYVKHPLIAVLFKRLHRCESYTKLYEVVPEGRIIEEWDMCGSTTLTLVKQLEIPKVNNIQRIAFSILCAKEVYKEEKFVRWANDWLSGKDRSYASAKVAEAAAYEASYTAAAYAAAYKASYTAAEAAAYKAACTAAYAAYAAEVTNINAAYYAIRVHGSISSCISSCIDSARIDLISIAKRAMEIQ